MTFHPNVHMYVRVLLNNLSALRNKFYLYLTPSINDIIEKKKTCVKTIEKLNSCKYL